MSYDVYLEMDTGGPEPVECFWRNYTSNCAQMWRHAGVDLRVLHGVKAADAGWKISDALKRMRSDPKTYEAMNPANGWGSYETCIDFLEDVEKGCDLHPKATVRISA